jgi:sec-independent protein translocase protein TatA
LIRNFFGARRQNPTTEYLKAQMTLIRPRTDPVTIAVMPGNIGPLEIAIVLIIALLVFGPKRLPELGKSLGKGIREFKGSISGEHDDEDEKPQLSSSGGAAPPSEKASEPEPARDKSA